MRPGFIFLFAAIVTFALDQGIKSIFLHGWTWQSPCISLDLVFNHGVAFSLFAFLGPWLKWIQLLLLAGILLFILKKGYLSRYAAPLGILLGAGAGNLFDRFIHGGVVDYVAWHCGFRFAVFNFADIMIDLAVLWLLWLNFKEK